MKNSVYSPPDADRFEERLESVFMYLSREELLARDEEAHCLKGRGRIRSVYCVRENYYRGLE